MPPSAASSGREKALKRADQTRDQGHTRAGTGKYDDAEALYQKCLQLRVEHLGEDDPSVAAINTDMGDMWMSQHEFAKAEPYYAAAASIITRCVAKEPQDASVQMQHRRALRDMAFLHYRQGSVERKNSPRQTAKWQLAERFFKEAIEITENQLGRKTAELVEPLRNLASLYVKIGNFQKGELHFRRCIGIQLHNFGMDDPGVLQTRQQLAIVHERREQRSRHDAAAKIQAMFRGFKARQRTRELRQERQLAKNAVLPGGIGGGGGDGGAPNGGAAVAEADTPNGAPIPATQGYYASGCDLFGDYTPDDTAPEPVRPASQPARAAPRGTSANSMSDVATATPTEQQVTSPVAAPEIPGTSALQQPKNGGYNARQRERDRVLQIIERDAAAAKRTSLQSTGTARAGRHLTTIPQPLLPSGLGTGLASKLRPWAIRGPATTAETNVPVDKLTAEEEELLGYLPAAKPKNGQPNHP
eukprot:TRINITY_DN65553_c0_g1_i1.p1 TRINITY_DN65553_c0_g1~~TRINITY_DN65553_c0_g1_i1.p1  ORF type:complete len:501 (+),score=118.79 TRINITY_DN65553_c0_g1_i1:86-1504(+)